MAATVSVVTGPEVPGNRKFVTATVTFDSSYATGGEAITASSLGLNRLDFIWAVTQDGYVPSWDGSTTAPKIKLYWVDTTTDGAALAEVPSTTDVSAVVVRVFAFGA
jgi:hypothetical protein